MKNTLIIAILIASVCCLVAQTPITPENITIQISGSNTIITWDPVEGVTGYVVYANVGDTNFQFLAFTENASYVFPISSKACLFQIASYTGNLRQRIMYNLDEGENLPVGCSMTVALEPRGHRSNCRVTNNSNREMGYQINYSGYDSPFYQNRIFQDRRVGIGETSFWFQGQDDRYNPSLTQPIDARDLPLNTWLDFNLVIYIPNCFPSDYHEMGPFVFNPSFWETLNVSFPQFIQESYEKSIKFHENGTFEMVDRVAD